MFSKLALFTAASMVVFVAASSNDGTKHSCNTGEVQCCNSLAETDSDGISQLFALLGISLSGVTGQVGVVCSPISLGGVGKGSLCNSEPVCCSQNHFNGLLAVGCNPIDLSL